MTDVPPYQSEEEEYINSSYIVQSPPITWSQAFEDFPSDGDQEEVEETKVDPEQEVFEQLAHVMKGTILHYLLQGTQEINNHVFMAFIGWFANKKYHVETIINCEAYLDDIFQSFWEEHKLEIKNAVYERIETTLQQIQFFFRNYWQ